MFYPDEINFFAKIDFALFNEKLILRLNRLQFEYILTE